MDHLITQLRKLKEITPDAEYTRRSRAMLLGMFPSPSASPTRWRSFFQAIEWGTAITLASVLFLLIGSIPLLKTSLPLRVAGLDPNVLSAEAEELQLSIKISELKAYESNAHTIGTALESVAHDIPNQLNPSSIETEKEDTAIASPLNTSIDAGLETLLTP